MTNKGKGRPEIVAAVILGVATILAALVGILYANSSKYSDLTLLDFAYKEEQLFPNCAFSGPSTYCGIQENPLISSNQTVAECISNKLYSDDTLIKLKPKSILLSGYRRQIPNTGNRIEGVMLIAEEFDSSAKATLLYTYISVIRRIEGVEPYVSAEFFRKGRIVLILASVEATIGTDDSFNLAGTNQSSTLCFDRIKKLIRSTGEK